MSLPDMPQTERKTVSEDVHEEALPWQRALSHMFKRVVCFKIEGTQARVVYTYGVVSSSVCVGVSLSEPSPLRWAIEAGGAVLGSGYEPHHADFLESLGIPVPRAFAVLPRLEQQRLAYLVYVDAGYEPLSVLPVLEAWNQGVSDVENPVQRARSIPSSEDLFWKRLRESAQHTRVKMWTMLAACGALLVFSMGVLTWVTASPPVVVGQKRANDYLMLADTLDALASDLYKQQRIQYPAVFKTVWGWMAGTSMPQPGYYEVRAGLWVWDVVRALKQPMLPSYHVSVLPGMTGADISELFVASGHVSQVAWLQATHSALVLNAYNIPSHSVEGYLLPGTYWFKRSMSAEQIVRAMLDHFYETIQSIEGLAQLPASDLHDKIYIASMVEKESRKPEEMKRFAGLVHNRLKKRLTLAGKAELQSPSLNALQAAMLPEEHGYLYALPRGDGSGLHIFLSTRSEYEKTVRLLEQAQKKPAQP